MDNITNHRQIIEECENINENIFGNYSFLESELKDLRALNTEIKKLLQKEESEETTVKIEVLELQIEEMINDIELETLSDTEEIQEKFHEALHEAVDGHEWVVYTGQAWDVANIMKSDDIAVSEFEELSCGSENKDLDQQMTLFCYSALFGHCMKLADENFKTWLENELDKIKGAE